MKASAVAANLRAAMNGTDDERRSALARIRIARIRQQQTATGGIARDVAKPLASVAASIAAQVNHPEGRRRLASEWGKGSR